MSDYRMGQNGQLYKVFRYVKTDKVYTLEELKKEQEKKDALNHHNRACIGQSIFNLPYRILHDNQVKHEGLTLFGQEGKIENLNEVPINLYYPYDGLPEAGRYDYLPDVAELLGITDDVYISILRLELGSGRKKLPQVVQDKVDAQAKPFRKWDLETEQGRQGWFYYFMAFIMPYEDDIPHWSVFDMFGDIQHTEQELKERQRYFLALIEKAKERPELYKHDIAVKGEYL